MIAVILYRMQDAIYPLFTAEQSRIIDRRLITEFGYAGYDLMQRAGEAAYVALRRRWPMAQSLCVVCGSGNNGGDGLVLARLAHAAGLEVRVVMLGRGPHSGSEASLALADWLACGGRVESFAGTLPSTSLYVDGLFGTGLARAPQGEWAAAIEALEGRDVLALDVPSGLDADRGSAPGVTVRAALTVSFIVRKRGLYTGLGPDCCGETVFADLDVPPEAVARLAPAAFLRQGSRPLPPRPPSSHKGENGHVLLIGGAPGMSGAVRLAGEAALRTGAGLVTVATHPAHASFLNSGRWELMVRGISGENALAPLLAKADVLALGPGMGLDEWGDALWSRVTSESKPLVVDADGLNRLAKSPLCRDDWVLTPHPAEAGRLLGVSAAEVQLDRFAAVREISGRYGGVCVLKGAGTLVQAREEVTVCAAGNPGMATAGMGDVLTGIIAALMAQGLPPAEAAREGVCLHASAGDVAALKHGQRGLLAGDVAIEIPRLINP